MYLVEDCPSNYTQEKIFFQLNACMLLVCYPHSCQYKVIVYAVMCGCLAIMLTDLSTYNLQQSDCGDLDSSSSEGFSVPSVH